MPSSPDLCRKGMFFLLIILLTLRCPDRIQHHGQRHLSQESVLEVEETAVNQSIQVIWQGWACALHVGKGKQ